ncbi:MAG: orotidine 5'-phosphate decarboxylase [Erysipelotrichaceae bacterium]|nr:orotidine 5'-phosphate decarboxylase [Erysipelotrichaceae bacterium]
MKLQCAFDLMSFEEMEKRLEKIVDYIDIIEVGTPMIIDEGQRRVKYFSEKYPNKCILSDCKIMDGGKPEADMAFNNGAKIVTVCACAADATILDVIKSAKEHGGQVLCDLIGIKDVEGRAKWLEEAGVDYVCVHTAKDTQSDDNNPLDELHRVKAVVKNAQVSVAGGINMKTLDSMINEGPDVIIVGGAIHNAEDWEAACKTMYGKIKAA